MHKHFPVLGFFILVLTACGADTEQQNAPPPPATEQTDKGTKVRIGSDGVNVETDKVDIKISSDSGAVRIGD
jgi:hypothetical protein